MSDNCIGYGDDLRFIILWTVQLIAGKQPELKSRLPSFEGVKPDLRPISNVDTSIAKDRGLSFTSYEMCLLDTVDALLQKENKFS